MHLADNIWVVITEIVVIFGLIIAILVKVSKTIDQ